MTYRSTLGTIALIASFAACGGTQTTATETTPTGASAAPVGSSVAPASASPEPTASAEPASASPSPVASASPAPIELPPLPANLHGPATPWDHMNAHQKADYMDHSILPVMREMFHAFDPTHFANVSCATCHGTNARAVHFHMPNRLPTFPAFGTPESNTHRAEHARMYAFMHERVAAAMAQLLGEQPYDPATHQGFGCFNCHPHS
jgi:mono/diheme cytochrome c family protein